MRTFKPVFLFVLVFLMIFTTIKNVKSASQTTSHILPSESFATQSGSTTGMLSALQTFDQSGADDNPNRYTTFTTPGNVHVGYRVFRLPAEIRMERITSLLLQVNFKSPVANTQVWTWSIYNWKSQMWKPVGDTLGSGTGMWETATFTIKTLPMYVAPTGEIRLQLKSSNSKEDLKVDYEAFHITYIPIAPTPTREMPTSAPTKSGFSLPITFTPSPTSTPTHTPTITSTPSITAQPACAAFNTAFEEQLLALINQERISRGIPALSMNSELSDAALGHSQDMACNDFIGHSGSDNSTPGDRIATAGYDFSTWGENVAAGYTSPSSVVNAWMSSSGHRGNILNPSFTEIGLGYGFNNTSYFGHYWTADFGSP